MSATGTVAAANRNESTPFQQLLPALRRLDGLLARAAQEAETAYGGKGAADPYRGLYVSTEEVERLVVREPGAPVFTGAIEAPAEHTRLSLLQTIFELNVFDTDALLIALAPELDLRYERLYAYLQDDITRRRPGVDLVLNLLCTNGDAKAAARARFAPGAPLIRHRIASLVADPAQPNAPLLAHFLKIDDAVVRWLLDQPGLDARLAGFAKLEDRPSESTLDASRAMQALAAQARANGTAARFYLCGPGGSGKMAAAEGVAHALQAPLISVDLLRAAAASLDFDGALALLFREARLLGAVLYFDALDTLRTEAASQHLRVFAARLAESPGIVLAAGEMPWRSLDIDVIEVGFRAPDYTQRRQAWQGQLAAAKIPIDDATLDGLAGNFKFTGDEIAHACTSAVNGARLSAAYRKDSQVTVSAADLLAAARAQCSNGLGTMARKIAAAYLWKDIVLPEDQLAQLHEICAQARLRHIVYGDWGFDRKLSLGKGLNVLFSGPPGTGKTMAAEIIANELGLDLYKIDLSQIVSKYIGDTEKNLNRIFEAARSSNAIIFFDEADALFGKRSEVRDSHDRYANIEISYLLQKMEEYEGISILATNLRQNLDLAFMRRLSFTIDFPFPDEDSRRLIWKAIWPPETPLAPDLDLDFMARQFKLSGGSVKNIAVAAAFMAASAKTSVGTVHLVKAARREIQKQGRTVSKTELGKYADRLEMHA